MVYNYQQSRPTEVVGREPERDGWNIVKEVRALQSGQQSKRSGTRCGQTDQDRDPIAREGPGYKWVLLLFPPPNIPNQTGPCAILVTGTEAVGSARKQNTCYFNRE